MEQQKTPEKKQNLVRIDKCIGKDKTQYTIQYEMSDLAFQQFQGFNEKICLVPIQEVELLSKQLDQPLPWFKRVGASVLGIKTRHEFLLFGTSQFLLTVDFYKGNRIRVRVGDQNNVLGEQLSIQRNNSQIVKTQEGLQWCKHFKQGQLYVQDIIDCLMHKQLQAAHSQISFHGSHFSKKLWNDLLKIADKKRQQRLIFQN